MNNLVEQLESLDYNNCNEKLLTSEVSKILKDNFETIIIHSPITATLYTKNKDYSLFINSSSQTNFELYDKDGQVALSIELFIERDKDCFLTEIFEKYAQFVELVEEETSINSIELKFKLLMKEIR